MILYLDASALVKRHIQEKASQDVNAWIEATDMVVTGLITRVEVAGTYNDPFGGGGPQPGYRLLGAIVITEDAGYFLKMVGPDKTMTQARPAFDAMLKTIGLEAPPR